jgi:tripartite-type tricarboxylate transporter receptor subunit TctC
MCVHDRLHTALAAALLLVFAALAALPVPAAAYPTKTITLVVPFRAGSAPDTTFRILAELAEKDLGQKIVVLNRPGPGGTIGTSEVVQAAPDGYTIGMSAVAVVVLQPLLQDLPYKGPDDMALIAQTNAAPTAMAVKADAPWRTLDQLLADAKKRPGQISVGLGGGLHTVLHVGVALLERAAGVRFNVVPFDAGAQLPAVLGGTVDVAIGQTVLFSPHVKAGKVRALAQFAETRVKGYEDVPTLKDAGYDVALIPYEFVIAPKGTPRAVVERLAATFQKAVESPTFRDFADKRGLVVHHLGPQALEERLRGDAALYRRVVDEFGWPKKK